MKRLESNLLNMVLSLTIISVVAASLLAVVFTLTEEPIEQAQVAKQQAAIKSVLPDGEFTIADADTVDGVIIRKAYANGEFVGAAVEAEATGFSGAIRLMVGFDKDGNIVNYEVLQQTETPGLGTKVVDWFKNPDKPKQNIKGKNPATTTMIVSKDGGDVDAITAATISSRAFLKAVQTAYNAYMKPADVYVTVDSIVSSVLPAVEGIKVRKPEMPLEGTVVYKAYVGDSLVGAAVEAGAKGFEDTIRIVVGFDAQDNIVNYEVLSHKETTSFGPKKDWFKTEQSIIGKNPATTKLSIRTNGGDVDAIAGATISSKGFLQAVQLAYDAYKTTTVKANAVATEAISETENK